MFYSRPYSILQRVWGVGELGEAIRICDACKIRRCTPYHIHTPQGMIYLNVSSSLHINNEICMITWMRSGNEAVFEYISSDLSN